MDEDPLKQDCKWTDGDLPEQDGKWVDREPLDKISKGQMENKPDYIFVSLESNSIARNKFPYNSPLYITQYCYLKSILLWSIFEKRSHL